MWENGLIKKIKVNLKIYDVTTWSTNSFNKDIETSLSRSKGNQTMKLDQLIEYNMRNIFLEKSYINYGVKTSPRPFSKKSKLSISLDQQSNVLYSLLLNRTKAVSSKLYLFVLFVIFVDGLII